MELVILWEQKNRSQTSNNRTIEGGNSCGLDIFSSYFLGAKGAGREIYEGLRFFVAFV